MMAERGIDVAHSTILRWVTRFVPEGEKRWDRYRRRVGGSWRVDETYVCVRAKWHYLYRAVDQYGQTIDFVLRKDRGVAAAQAFFRKALATHGNHFPRTVTLDGHRRSRAALWKLRMEHVRWRHGKVRTRLYLNNIIEQDHRGIKARYGPMKCFNSFANAAITLARLKLAHRIRKHPFSVGRGYRFGRNRMRDWGIALA